MKNLVVFFKGEYEKNHKNDAFFCIPEIAKKGFLDFFKKFDGDNINIYICRGES